MDGAQQDSKAEMRFLKSGSLLKKVARLESIIFSLEKVSPNSENISRTGSSSLRTSDFRSCLIVVDVGMQFNLSKNGMLHDHVLFVGIYSR